MNNTVLLTVLAVVLAAVTNTATAELLEPLYPEKYQETTEEEARLARLEPEARTVEYRAELDTTSALRGTMEARMGEDTSFRADTLSVSLFDEPEAEARAARLDARLDGESGKNLFGVPLPP